jgi:hypothetical protein
MLRAGRPDFYPPAQRDSAKHQRRRHQPAASQSRPRGGFMHGAMKSCQSSRNLCIQSATEATRGKHLLPNRLTLPVLATRGGKGNHQTSSSDGPQPPLSGTRTCITPATDRPTPKLSRQTAPLADVLLDRARKMANPVLKSYKTSPSGQMLLSCIDLPEHDDRISP